MLLIAAATIVNAVPARRGWQVYTQADGTTIEVQQMGDEFYHYMINRTGQELRENEQGLYEVVGEAPSGETVNIRRAQGKARRIAQETGLDPYPAPRGLIVLINFSDVSFESGHDNAVMDSLLTAKDCQVNNGFGSAAQYFADQSNGLYQPVFDVYGPVTLSKTRSYYGKNDSQGNDQYATDAVIEACILANEQYADLDFSNYDWNNDGYVDFVYAIYAGKGEADGGGSNTIWPHNYNIQYLVGTSYSKYKKSDTYLDEKYLNSYAMSQELDGTTGSLSGIGTFCHEFGHVIGFPDYYDTDYGKNYSQLLTPNEWDIMDGGSYNGDGHCPAGYSAWEKYFMGWLTPENLGSNGASLTLYPSGTAEHNVYQINESGQLESATKEGLNYYIECREKKGWDTYLPAAGMLIWKVDYNAYRWSNNAPNQSRYGSPRYTLVIPDGTTIGSSAGARNVWPYITLRKSVDSWEGVTGKPLKDMKRSDNLVTLTYIEAAQGLEKVETDASVKKIIRNGQVLIERNGVVYNLQGAVVR